MEETFGSGSAFGQAFEHPTATRSIVVLRLDRRILGAFFGAFRRQDLQYQG